MFSRKNKNLPDKEYPASASESKSRQKPDLSEMDCVYAGPDEMSGRTPIAPVYAGPEQMNNGVPSGAFTDSGFKMGFPIPQNLNQPIAMMVYAGPEQMNNGVPSGAFTDSGFKTGFPIPQNLNQPIAMMVYAGPEQMRNLRPLNIPNPDTPLAAQPQNSYVDGNTPSTVCKVCGATIPLTSKFCSECGSINENRPTPV